MSRYDRDQTFINRKKYLTGKHTRGDKFIEHFATAVLNHPGVMERSSLAIDTHIWKYGDRFYNLANKYYGNPELCGSSHGIMDIRQKPIFAREMCLTFPLIWNKCRQRWGYKICQMQ